MHVRPFCWLITPSVTCHGSALMFRLRCLLAVTERIHTMKTTKGPMQCNPTSPHSAHLHGHPQCIIGKKKRHCLCSRQVSWAASNNSPSSGSGTLKLFVSSSQSTPQRHSHFISPRSPLESETDRGIPRVSAHSPPFKIWAPLPKASYRSAARWWANLSRSLYSTNPSRSLYAICLVLSTNYMFTVRSSSTSTDELCVSSVFHLMRTAANILRSVVYGLQHHSWSPPVVCCCWCPFPSSCRSPSTRTTEALSFCLAASISCS
jgi:hypothetical protein